MCMNRILLVLFTSIFGCSLLTAQIGVQVVAQSGVANTTCVDGPFTGAPDPLFGVSVEGSEFSYYPEEALCFCVITHHRDEIFWPAGAAQECQRFVIDREEAHRCAILRCHIGDGCAIWY